MGVSSVYINGILIHQFLLLTKELHISGIRVDQTKTFIAAFFSAICPMDIKANMSYSSSCLVERNCLSFIKYVTEWDRRDTDILTGGHGLKCGHTFLFNLRFVCS